MNLSRRGFLGGAVAALVTNILVAPGAAAEPRTWLWARDQEFYDPMHQRIIARFYGVRNDGVLFYSDRYLWTVDPGPATAAARSGALADFNLFLHPQCNCRPGFHCGLHSGLPDNDGILLYAGD